MYYTLFWPVFGSRLTGAGNPFFWHVNSFQDPISPSPEVSGQNLKHTNFYLKNMSIFQVSKLLVKMLHDFIHFAPIFMGVSNFFII